MVDISCRLLGKKNKKSKDKNKKEVARETNNNDDLDQNFLEVPLPEATGEVGCLLLKHGV
ncbi:hypothetical protein EON65_00055 [archaeon]|nr:MAG: hypothetical protein EON65_00055 [archaeon]